MRFNQHASIHIIRVTGVRVFREPAYPKETTTGATITEKILARAAGLASVTPGDEVMVKPDFVLVYDFPGYTNVDFSQLKQDLHIERIAEPERFGIFIDHMVPAAFADEEAYVA